MHAKGDKLDHFTIVGEIGRGGMGTIYKALDEILNRYVALKIIHPQLALDELLMERFRVEATTQAQLSHPNIVTVYSFNRIGNEFVMVMEYVEGQSLKEIIQCQRVLPVGYAISIIKSVLAGLSYAHGKQVIHRDVKPANILVGENGTVKLLDFGIAKIFGTEGLTKTGALIGTPWYCSPEQILGTELDYRTDIYSASISFYQMITGRVPFDSESNSEYQIQKAHLETPPPRPMLFNSQINRQLERIVLKGLAKKSNKRYASAEVMADDLIAIEPEYLRSSDAPDNKKRSPPKNRLYMWLWVLIPVAVLMLILNLRKEVSKPNVTTRVKPNAETTQIHQAEKIEAHPAVKVEMSEPQKTKAEPSARKAKPPLRKKSVAPVTDSKRPQTDSKPTVDTDQRLEAEREMTAVSNLLDNHHFVQAERLVDRLVQLNPYPRAFCLAGSTKFFAAKYKQGESLWRRGLDAGSEIRLAVAHAHGFVQRGCSGFLVLRQNMLQFDSVSKSEHSFAIMSAELVSAAARGSQLVLSWKERTGKINRDYFLLDWSQNERDVERFSTFLSELFKEE